MKIAMIVQRYGEEVNGGAELHCKMIAERIKDYHDVEVITTKALEYTYWKNFYKEDFTVINGVKVRRFKVLHKRNKIFQKIMYHKIFSGKFKTTLDDELRFIKYAGPYVPNLISYLEENYDNYDLFMFFTYLYYPSVMGITKFGEKSVLFPCAHDEPFLNLNIIKQEFCCPKSIFYNTAEEKQLINSRFHNESILSDIGGAGVDLPDKIGTYNLEDDYIVYVGRIDYGKACDVLLNNFVRYKNENRDSNLKLVLVGKNFMKKVEHPDIIYTGFVSDEEKFSIINSSKLLVLPSKFESLSLVVLEAFALSKTVLVNGECEVLKAHCVKSNAGLYYTNYYEFSHALKYLLTNDKIRGKMEKNAKEYVDINYTWDRVIGRLNKLFDRTLESVNNEKEKRTKEN